MKLSPGQLEEIARATERGRTIIRPGDVIVRASCLGDLEPFYFRAWEGQWMCGNHSPDAKRRCRDTGWGVNDCTATAVRSVNGHAIDLSDTGGPLPSRQILSRPNLIRPDLSRPRAP